MSHQYNIFIRINMLYKYINMYKYILILLKKSSKDDCFPCIEDQKFTADEFINETFMSIVMNATDETRIEVHSILKPKILLVTSI